jgi:hypothetical protein
VADAAAALVGVERGGGNIYTSKSC